MSDPYDSFRKLIKIIDTLMGDNGCPWDKVQTRESLKPYLVEETYEALEALAGVVAAGGRGATVGRNIWGVEDITGAVEAVKDVIHGTVD